MTDREKVIKGFENCVFNYCDDDCMYKDEEWKASGFAAYRHFAREDIVEIPKRVLLDVLVLLKEQEAVKPKEVNMYPLGQYACGACGHISVGSKNYHAKYCPECGRAVIWSD